MATPPDPHRAPSQPPWPAPPEEPGRLDRTPGSPGPAGHPGQHQQPRSRQQRQPQPPPQPPRPPQPPQQAQPASPVLQQRAFAALLLVLIAILGMVVLSGNLKRVVVVLAVTLVIGATGLWLAVTAMSRSRRAGATRPRFSLLATVLGVLVTGMSALALTGFALFWTQFSQYANCTAGANTVAAQNACDQQLHDSLHASVPGLGG